MDAAPYRSQHFNAAEFDDPLLADASTNASPKGWMALHFSDRPHRRWYGIPVSHLQVIWTPVTVALNALIFLALLDSLHPRPIEWHPAFTTAFDYLHTAENWLLVPLLEMIETPTEWTVPDWGKHLIMCYAIAGSAFALESRTFETTSSPTRIGVSMFTAASWPLALTYFVLDMFRSGAVLHFIQEHSRFYRLYNVAVLVLFSTAVLANALLLNLT